MSKKYSVEWWQTLRPEAVGKETEKLVAIVLDELNKSQDFAHHRFPDARSARGVLGAQPSDSLLIYRGQPIFLEIKAIKHLYRLPSGRVSQLATLKKFRLAGAKAFVLVHHYMAHRWRIVSVDSLEIGQPSWDLSSHPLFDNVFDAMEGVL